ncbi:tRNA glutamyl-Q(34) synthetase GluQRS [Bordetella genomosp. 9]|uniref:tRNA glutamyl-Q(34) synthetase GluQRS n=1 Tax=Bordetella genomosp. 9 TaxID=1416803 RepID=UPI000A296B98|nr:tRNA glutamyl-Q(34) synthetase GluQRS [Bordetella genomosp. 9]ARP88905.1 tRNA glutamyl-Q(34) synthetase GluQRS [Bordetella genomosp. 9]
MNYIGRFAPSPSGPLHAGSLVAALASYLDARAHAGTWLLRIEDIDAPRTVPGADRVIMKQLRTLGLQWDGEVLWQSARDAVYRQAFDTLLARGLVYGCACTRREIIENHAAMEAARGTQQVLLDGERPYVGTCRNGLPPGRHARAWRLRVPEGIERFTDRWFGSQQQDVARAVGDFVLKRADGMWAYQLAVVVDDAAQGVTDVVRGADLLSSTARQRVLARLLGATPPRVMHVPLVLDPATGLKLSKQNHAPALDLSRPLETLGQAWRALGFGPIEARTPQGFLAEATRQWARRYKG